MGWSDTINVEDEYFHKKSDDPYWSENTLLGFTVPERNLCGFIYYYFRPNMNLVVAGPAMWDNTGEDVYNCLYYGWDQHLAIPDGAEMYDFALSNSLTAKMIEPQREYRFGYDRYGVKIDLTWTATMEPHYMKLTKTGEEDPGIKNWVKKDGDLSVGHYEQPGRFQGTIEIRGERIEIDCGALRDRGWGPRHADVSDPWSLVKWKFDGQVAYGEDQDFMTFRHYRKYWNRLLEKDPGLLNCLPTRQHSE